MNASACVSPAGSRTIRIHPITATAAIDTTAFTARKLLSLGCDAVAVVTAAVCRSNARAASAGRASSHHERDERAPLLRIVGELLAVPLVVGQRARREVRRRVEREREARERPARDGEAGPL